MKLDHALEVLRTERSAGQVATVSSDSLVFAMTAQGMLVTCHL